MTEQEIRARVERGRLQGYADGYEAGQRDGREEGLREGRSRSIRELRLLVTDMEAVAYAADQHPPCDTERSAEIVPMRPKP